MPICIITNTDLQWNLMRKKNVAKLKMDSVTANNSTSDIFPLVFVAIILYSGLD